MDISNSSEGVTAPRNYKQRSKNHDYKSKCIYMITILKRKDLPVFSSVMLSAGGKPECKFHPIGFIIYNCIRKFNNKYKEARIQRFIIMPDHVHFIIDVKEHLKYQAGLGNLIAIFKHLIRSEYMERFPESPFIVEHFTLFDSGFNDMILKRVGQLDRMYSYINDNPRRYYIKRNNPDLFSTKSRVEINGNYYQAIGNTFLLMNPELTQARYSSKFTASEWEAKREECIETIENGGILVSPFIHAEEKKLMAMALEHGKGIILIQNRYYGDRDKPGGQYFDYCAAGKLLIISINRDGNRNPPATRQCCLEMNNFAKTIIQCFSNSPEV